MRLEASAAAALRLGIVSVETPTRTGTLGQLWGFDLDQYLGEGTEGEGPVPCTVGNDAVPEQAGVPAAVPIAVVAALPVRVMVVFDSRLYA